MALNKEYFDAIHIDVVKKKYYNANKVEAVFSDIRQQAEAMYEENLAMKAQLENLHGSKLEIGEAVLSAQSIYKDIVEKAKAEAAQIIEEAESRRESIMAESNQMQEYAVHQVQACYTRLKEQHMASIEALNAEWQSFLCGLYPQDSKPEKVEAPEVPEDLSEKVSAIAKELFAIGNEE